MSLFSWKISSASWPESAIYIWYFALKAIAKLFLLFAGALHTNFEQLKVQRWPVLVFATLGTLVSTFLVGTIMFYSLQIIGFNIGFIYCLLFGALISATDPVAVISLFKELGAPERLTILVEGESLLNDAKAIVVFKIILLFALSGHVR